MPTSKSTQKNLNPEQTKKIINTNEITESNSNYNSLPPDVISQHIAAALDIDGLVAYAMLNKTHLKLLKNALEQRLPQLRIKLVTSLCHTFLITNTGVYGTGYNRSSQLGLGDMEIRYYFTPINTLPNNIREIISNTPNTFFISETDVYVCGTNHGALGLDNKEHPRTPVKVSNKMGKINSVASFYGSHTFFLTDTETFACGYNQEGRLGVGHKEKCIYPILIKGISEPIKHIITHSSHHTLALTDTRAYACHGYTVQSFIEIKRFPGTLKNISVGGHQSYYLTDQGLYYWGIKCVKAITNNSELPDEFIAIKGLSGSIREVKSGQAHAFILTDKALYSGGSNAQGQLGQGTTKNEMDFLEVKGIEGTILQIALGDMHSFVLTDQGLYACGHNMYGQLGLGDYTDKRVFTKVKAIVGTIQQVYAGESQSFLVTDKGLYASGRCDAGQLGIGPVAKNTIISSVQVKEPVGSLSVNSFVPVKQVPDAVIKQWQSYQQSQRMIKMGDSLEKHGIFAINPADAPSNKLTEIISNQVSFK